MARQRQNETALILFDIDGTLLLSGRAGLRAMTRAFDRHLRHHQRVQGRAFGGRTDSYLVSKALQAAGLPDTPEQHTASARTTSRCWPRRSSIPAPATRD